jgi:hypothetical protein
MAKLQGVIRRNSVEGGVWTLAAQDGITYQLIGADPGALSDGARVEVEGEVDEQAMGFAMVGPHLKVRSIHKK